MADKETLKNDLEELLRKMHNLRCMVAKVGLKADAHESTIKNMLHDFVTRNDECLREDLYNIVLFSQEISLYILLSRCRCEERREGRVQPVPGGSP